MNLAIVTFYTLQPFECKCIDYLNFIKVGLFSWSYFSSWVVALLKIKTSLYVYICVCAYVYLSAYMYIYLFRSLWRRNADLWVRLLRATEIYMKSFFIIFFFNPLGAECATADSVHGQGQIRHSSESRTGPHGSGQATQRRLQVGDRFHPGAHQRTAGGLPKDGYVAASRLRRERWGWKLSQFASTVAKLLLSFKWFRSPNDPHLGGIKQSSIQCDRQRRTSLSAPSPSDALIERPHGLKPR